MIKGHEDAVAGLKPSEYSSTPEEIERARKQVFARAAALKREKDEARRLAREREEQLGSKRRP